jgi:hypothetical protein
MMALNQEPVKPSDGSSFTYRQDLLCLVYDN